MKKQTALTIFAILIALIAVAACQLTIIPPATTPTSITGTWIEIPFENVALNEWGVNDKMGQEPQLFVLMTAKDIVKVQPFISNKALKALQQIPWNEYAVIAVFRGVQGCSLYGIGIERLIVERDTLVVNAQFWKPPPNFLCQTVLTSPYHLVKVHKSGIKLDTLTPIFHSRIVEKGDSSDQEKIGAEKINELNKTSKKLA